LDIVPFGGIAGSNNNIYWPPEDLQAMSVTGFTEMAKKALSVTIDNTVRISVASLPGIFILKLSAWRDRCRLTNKDADDIFLIIDEYLEINLARAVKEHQDIYESENFSTFIAGATLIGRDAKMILTDNMEVLIEFSGIIESEVSQAEHSLLINQMLETHPSKKYEEVYEALTSIRNELKR
jgi:predicted nucleotidyltransferase